MASKICAVLLVAPFAFALRSSRQNVSRSTSQAGTLLELYNFGMPKVSQPALRNPARDDGCFNGARVINVKTNHGRLNTVDSVPPIFPRPWEHVMMPVMEVDQNGKVKKHPCSWKDSDAGIRSHGLHDGKLYANQASKIASLHTVVEVGLRQSYKHAKHDVAKIVGGLGWNLVGSAWARSPKQVSHLMQDPITLDCILTFEGSSTNEHWFGNINKVLVPFCGLPEKFHQGFTKFTRGMVRTTEFQRDIRGNLGKCRKVSIAGHSLGGAIGALFAACSSSRVRESAKGRPDFDLMSWTKGKPALLPAV